MSLAYAAFGGGRYAARLKRLQGVEDAFELSRGVSRLEGFPKNASFEMSEKFPDRLQLEDLLFNLENLLVISDRFKTFLEGKSLKNVEFLPVTIVNHKGRKEKAPYWIFHQTELQDCIDLEKSVYEPNPIQPELMMIVTALVVDEARVDPEVQVFRMARFPNLPVLRGELAEAIVAEGFTGIKVGDLSAWKQS